MRVGAEEAAVAHAGWNPDPLPQRFRQRPPVDPLHQRCGVGSALLDHAKSVSPSGLELHTHQQNLRALAFYGKAGFVPVRWGLSPPPECVLDVELHWRPFGDAP